MRHAGYILLIGTTCKKTRPSAVSTLMSHTTTKELSDETLADYIYVLAKTLYDLKHDPFDSKRHQKQVDDAEEVLEAFETKLLERHYSIKSLSDRKWNNDILTSEIDKLLQSVNPPL